MGYLALRQSDTSRAAASPLRRIVAVVLGATLIIYTAVALNRQHTARRYAAPAAHPAQRVAIVTSEDIAGEIAAATGDQNKFKGPRTIFNTDPAVLRALEMAHITRRNFSIAAVLATSTQERGMPRVASQLVTFLRSFERRLVLGEEKFNVGNDTVEALLSLRDEQESKYLVALSALYEKFPMQEWYLLMTDTTHVVYENLAFMLKDRPADDLLFFGAPKLVSTECGDSSSSVIAAAASAGIVLSRSTARLLIENADSCLSKYLHCATAETLLALCLRDARASFTDALNSTMHASGPDHALDWAHEACSRPASFATSQTTTTHALHSLAAKRAPLRYSQLFAEYVTAHNVTIERGFDRVGHDYKVFIETHSDGDCRWACGQESVCAAWSYDASKEKCVLKKGVGPRRATTGIISGVLANRYFCFMDEF